MKKRNCRFEVRFTKDELSDLTRKARKARLTNAAFIRRAVCGAEVKEAPPADGPLLIGEVRRVGYNIDQILKLANARGMLDVPRLRKALDDNRAVERMIADAYTMGPGDAKTTELWRNGNWAKLR